MHTTQAHVADQMPSIGQKSLKAIMVKKSAAALQETRIGLGISEWGLVAGLAVQIRGSIWLARVPSPNF